MTRLDTFGTLSESIKSPIETRAVDDSVLSSGEVYQNRLGWDNIIDVQLIEWGKDPSWLEDDGLEPPSRQIIGLACCVAQAMRDEGAPPPLRVVPDGDGGIAFEWKDGTASCAVEIEEDGSVEMITFENSRLVSRQRIQ